MKFYYFLFVISTMLHTKNMNSTTVDIKVTLSTFPVTKMGILLRMSNPKTTNTALM